MIRSFAFLLAFFGTLSVSAQQMKDVVREMPDSICPLLTKNNRLDFVDYLDSKMKAEVTNRLNGKSEMTVLTDDYTFIKMSKSSVLEMKLLPFGDEKIICMVKTAMMNDSVADSQVKFYSLGWKALPQNTFLSLPKDDNDVFCQYLLSAENTDLEIVFSDLLAVKFEGDKDGEKRKEKVLKWNSKFE